MKSKMWWNLIASYKKMHKYNIHSTQIKSLQQVVLTLWLEVCLTLESFFSLQSRPDGWSKGHHRLACLLACCLGMEVEVWIGDGLLWRGLWWFDFSLGTYYWWWWLMLVQVGRYGLIKKDFNQRTITVIFCQIKILGFSGGWMNFRVVAEWIVLGTWCTYGVESNDKNNG